MPIRNTALADVFGVNETYIRECLNNTRGKSERWVYTKLSPIIKDIEARKLCFTGLGELPRFLWLEPPKDAPWIPRWVSEEEWSLWACCEKCQRNQFLPVTMNSKPHAMCYYCLPPVHHAGLGAKWDEKKSLITEALKKHY